MKMSLPSSSATVVTAKKQVVIKQIYENKHFNGFTIILESLYWSHSFEIRVNPFVAARILNFSTYKKYKCPLTEKIPAAIKVRILLKKIVQLLKRFKGE